jgi:hypothetical protein
LQPTLAGFSPGSGDDSFLNITLEMRELEGGGAVAFINSGTVITQPDIPASNGFIQGMCHACEPQLACFNLTLFMLGISNMLNPFEAFGPLPTATLPISTITIGPEPTDSTTSFAPEPTEPLTVTGTFTFTGGSGPSVTETSFATPTETVTTAFTTTVFPTIETETSFATPTETVTSVPTTTVTPTVTDEGGSRLKRRMEVAKVVYLEPRGLEETKAEVKAEKKMGWGGIVMKMIRNA